MNDDTTSCPAAKGIELPRPCPHCVAGTLRVHERTKTYRPPGQDSVTLVTLHTECDGCRFFTTSDAQHEENLRRRAARKAGYGENFRGEELFSFRRSYGLRQGATEAIFGLRYGQWDQFENETAYPGEGARKLIELAMKSPQVLLHMAAAARQRIPLFSERHPEIARLVDPSTLTFPAI